MADLQGDRTRAVSVAVFHSAGSAIFGPLIAALNGPDQPDVRLSDFDVAQQDFPRLTADHDLVLAHRLVGRGGRERRIPALMPRYTTDLRDHPELVLRPLAHPELGRHIDCLARPETLERVSAVLSQIGTTAKGLIQRSPIG